VLSWVVTLLLPLLESAAFTLVFTLFVRPQVTPTTYFVFVYVGVFAWRAFAGGVTAAAATLPAAATVRQVPGPVLRAWRDALLAAPLVIAAVVLLRGVPPLGRLVVWLPVGIALQLAATLGLGWLVAVANLFNRDVGVVAGPLLSVLIFAAPVVYPTALVPVALRLVFLANPMAAAIEAYRAALLGGVPPPLRAVAVATVVAGVLLAAGWAFHRELPSGSC